MSNFLRNHVHIGLLLCLVTYLASFSTVTTAESTKPKAKSGEALTKELCQACHMFKGADQAGNVGPPFVAMKARFPEKAKIRAIIFDPQKAVKSDTMMPPFGRNGLVNEEEIEKIIEFLYTQ